MKPRKIKEGVSWIGTVDSDRRLFDALIPLPYGTSYNSYLIEGNEKTAILDTVDPRTFDVFIDKLNGLPSVDYIVSHHAEQDHSGAIPLVLKKFSNAKVVTTARCKGMLIDLLPIPDDRFITVKEGDTLSLGGKTLRFIDTPWVHWPETISTYLEEERILFSCDFFGSHFATNDLFASRNETYVYDEAKRYYSTIMMPFSAIIGKNLKKLEDYKIDMIAPSHGPIFDKPDFIIDAYKDWVLGEPKNTVLIPYISMHGSTKKMVDRLVDELVGRGVNVEQFELTHVDLGILAEALVDAATLVTATPVILGGAHPNIVLAAYIANILKPKLKFVSVISSFGWGARLVDQIKGLMPNIKTEMLEPVLCKGLPGDKDLEALSRLADIISEKHKGLGLIGERP